MNNTNTTTLQCHGGNPTSTTSRVPLCAPEETAVGSACCSGPPSLGAAAGAVGAPATYPAYQPYMGGLSPAFANAPNASGTVNFIRCPDGTGVGNIAGFGNACVPPGWR